MLLDAILETIVGWLWGLPLIFTVLFVGLYFTIGSKLFQFSYLPHIFKETFGKVFGKKDKTEDTKGILTPFQAVATAIGGSVGVGNMLLQLPLVDLEQFFGCGLRHS